VRAERGSVRNLAAAAGATTACVFPAFLTGGMGVQLRDDLGFGEAGLGLAIGAFFAAASVTSALLGRLAERVGPSAGLRLAAWGSAATQAVIAIGARSFASLLGLLAVAGAWNALAQPAANLFVARALPVNRQGLAFGVKQSAIPLSTMLAGVAVPAVALTVGWEWAFAAGAALAVAGAVVVPNLGVHTAPSAADDTRPVHGTAPRDAMAVLAIGIGLGAAAAGSLGGFLVSAGVAAGLDEGVAGLTLTLGSAVGIVVRLASGAQADRRDGGHLRVVALMLAGGTVAYCLLATGDSAVHLVATPLAFATGWAWPGLFNLAVVRANPGAPARATGITQTGTYIGAVTGPLLFGLVADGRSYSAAWLVAGVMSMCAAAAMLAGRARLRRARVATLDVPEVPT
jgi:MFS family permease